MNPLAACAIFLAVLAALVAVVAFEMRLETLGWSSLAFAVLALLVAA